MFFQSIPIQDVDLIASTCALKGDYGVPIINVAL